MSGVTTVEPVFSIRPVSDLDVMRTIRSPKPSRAKDKYGMDVICSESSLTLIKPITGIINLSLNMFQYLKMENPFLLTSIGQSVILPTVSEVEKQSS